MLPSNSQTPGNAPQAGKAPQVNASELIRHWSTELIEQLREALGGQQALPGGKGPRFQVGEIYTHKLHRITAKCLSIEGGGNEPLRVSGRVVIDDPDHPDGGEITFGDLEHWVHVSEPLPLEFNDLVAIVGELGDRVNAIKMPADNKKAIADFQTQLDAMGKGVGSLTDALSNLKAGQDAIDARLKVLEKKASEADKSKG